jgi:hypothetical protein
MSWMLDREITRELPREWKGVVPTEVFLEEAEKIVKEANARDIKLRILGGLGVAFHSQEFREFARKLGRVGTGTIEGQEYSDIDLMSYRKHRDKVKELFSDMEYAKRRATLSSAASERQIYYHPKGWFYVDVFFDKLVVANHPINFVGRLELDFPTVTVTDILLEKLQMWEAFSIKDLKDCLILLRTHSVEEKIEKESIDSEYVAKVLSEDWGFWFTATTNLQKIKKFIFNIEKLGAEVGVNPRQLKREVLEQIIGRIDKLLERIEKEPKSFKWKMRAKVGTKKRWYNPVERPETVGGFGIWENLLEK